MTDNKSLNNPYLPDLATVQEVIDETANIRTLRVTLDDKEKMAAFNFRPGQVGQISVFGTGESTFVINSPPTRRDYLQFSVMRVGEITQRIHQLNAGDRIGLRAPLGNGFQYEDMKGRDILFIGGGIGMAPLRTLLLHMIDNRADYGDITAIYGARSPKDLCYTYEFEEWKTGGVNLVLTVDSEFPGWKERVGFVPTILSQEAPSPLNRIAIVCGPPIMIKFVLFGLKELGFEDRQIITTLEKRMKCGIGICGRCNVGSKYVCVDGPVFNYEQIKGMCQEL
ncbi:flavin oxidoreductase, subunit FlxA [Syntrophobacter sp. SbD1]|nr:flavin oxidoreductase, subunit FlxA [Syntrophobacter sp. SbD1]